MFGRRKKVDQKTKDCIYGFVRNAQSEIPADNVYYTIPELVIHWILLYFYVKEAFDPDNCASFYKLSEDNMSFITEDSTNKTFLFGTAYLTHIAKKGIHKWKFKLLNLNNKGWNSTIGVWRCNHPFNINASMWDGSKVRGKEYGWFINHINTW